MNTNTGILSHVNMKFTTSFNPLGQEYKLYSREYYAEKLKEAGIYSEDVLNFVMSSNQDPMEWIYAFLNLKSRDKINVDEIQGFAQKWEKPFERVKKPKNPEWQNRIKQLMSR